MKAIFCMVVLSAMAVAASFLPNDGKQLPSKSNGDTLEEFPKLSDDSMKVNRMIIIVSSSLTEELRQDALYSILFSQMRADNKLSRTALFDQWTVDFNLASTLINWVIMSNYFGDLKVTQHEFKISDVALHEMNITMGGTVSAFNKTFNNLHERSTSDACIELLINTT